MEQPADRPVNDRTEGILRDPVRWKGGEIVSYVKDIGNGDPGYNANIRQVLIMKQDGTEQVVPESEILREVNPAAQVTTEPDRRPEHTLPPSLEGQDEGGDDKNRQARPAADQAARSVSTSEPAPQRNQGATLGTASASGTVRRQT